MKTTRTFLFSLIATAVLATSASVQAKTPITLVVAFTPGGPVDMVARTIAEPLSRELDRTIIVENRAGANGNIAATYVARAPKDGSVLFLTSVGAVAISPALYPKLSYDAAKDFSPISRVVNNATVFVVAGNNQAKDAADFVQRAKTAKDKPTIGSSGIGSIPHLTLELFNDASGEELLHVPYKGASQVTTDLIGGHVDGFFGDVPGLIGQIRSGSLKALGLASNLEVSALPGVTSLQSQGFEGVESNNWYGLLAPAGTPEETIETINAALRKALAEPKVKAQLEEYGAQVAPSTPQELADLMASDDRKWSTLIQNKNIQP